MELFKKLVLHAKVILHCFSELCTIPPVLQNTRSQVRPILISNILA